MPTLQIRDLPDDLYALLRKRASEERRSMAQEAVVVLAAGLTGVHEPARERRLKILADAAAKPVALPAKAPPPEVVVREDRER